MRTVAKFVQLKSSGIAKLATALLNLQSKLIELNVKQKSNRGAHQVRMYEAELRQEHGRRNAK
jgi:hypothetical protein